MTSTFTKTRLKRRKFTHVRKSRLARDTSQNMDMPNISDLVGKHARNVLVKHSADEHTLITEMFAQDTVTGGDGAKDC